VVVLVRAAPLDVSAQVGVDLERVRRVVDPRQRRRGVAMSSSCRRRTGQAASHVAAERGQEPINSGDGKTGLFQLGYGLTLYGHPVPCP